MFSCKRPHCTITALVVVAALAGSFGANAVAQTTTSAFFFVGLKADLDISGTNPTQESTVVSTVLTLSAGESRRITDRLELTLNSDSDKGAEVNNIIVCLDPEAQEVGRSSSGTNHPAGPLVLTETLLLRATTAGTYRCELRTYFNGPTDHHMTAIRGNSFADTGTWLQVSAANEAGSHEWRPPFCDTRGTLDTCQYLGGAGDPRRTIVFDQMEQWTATADATDVDLTGEFQFTSCYHGTGSCTSAHWGDDGILGKEADALIVTALMFDQLYPDGTVCRSNWGTNRVNFNNYHITNDVHHLPVAYLLTVPVASVCKGSRTFRVGVDVYWSSGNPVKIDGGKVNVINYTRSATATVPNVLDTNVLHAESVLRLQGFKPTVEDRVVNPASRGTVLDENPPGGTVAPTGSEVLLAVSLGQAIVPDVSGEPEAKALHLIAAAGLVASLSHPQTCIDPGLVSQQSPAAGAAVAPGSKVSLTVTTCKQGGNGK